MAESALAWNGFDSYQEPFGLNFPRSLTTIDFEEKGSALWLPRAKKNVEDLLSLKANWNSYGSTVITRTVALYAVTLLDLLISPDTPEPSIVPTARGNIQFEWHLNQIDLELEILPNSDVVCFFEDLKSGESVEKTYSFDWSELTSYIKRLS